MVAQDAAPEEVLRAAAAEVSTPSATRRLRLFRDTLPPLLAKATGNSRTPPTSPRFPLGIARPVPPVD